MSRNKQLFNEVTHCYITTCGRLEMHYGDIARQLYSTVEKDLGNVLGFEALHSLDLAYHKGQFHCLMLADEALCRPCIQRREGLQLRALVDDMHDEYEMSLLRTISHLSVGMVSNDALQGATLLSRHRLERHKRLRKLCRFQMDGLQYLYHDIVDKYVEGSNKFESISHAAITRLEGVCVS